MTALDLQIRQHNRQQAVLEIEGDPEDLDWLQYQLRNWLKANKWPERRWNEFTIRSFRKGENRVVRTVGAK
jgi:hypothetical protein